MRGAVGGVGAGTGQEVYGSLTLVFFSPVFLLSPAQTHQV